MPEGLSQAQQHQIRLAIAAGRTAQLQADKSILEDAKEYKRDASRLMYAFMLRHRCKILYIGQCCHDIVAKCDHI